MSKQLIVGLSICCALLLSACQAEKTQPQPTETILPSAESTAPEQNVKKNTYQQITAEEAKKMMDEGGVTVVDVRTAEEYNTEHISEAVLVPVESIGNEAPSELPDHDAILLVYCRSGNRSKTAAGRLVELGYTNVYEFGGIKDWPYTTEKGETNHE